MVTPILLANIHLDENGAYAYSSEPGDPDFVNPLADPNYSFVQATQDQLDYLEFVKDKISAADYERQRSFWSTFQQALERGGAK